MNPRPTDYEADQNIRSDANLRRNPPFVYPERVSIEDICLTTALSCPSKPAKMAHRWPRGFQLTMRGEPATPPLEPGTAPISPRPRGAVCRSRPSAPAERRRDQAPANRFFLMIA